MYWFYTRQFKKYLKIHRIPNRSIEGESEYLKKWSVFGVKVEPYSYRLFSRFTHAGSDIVPENIGRCLVETKLNPRKMRPVYEDKNMFPFICGKDNVPATILCRMNGGPILDSDLKPITENIDNYLCGNLHLILKPSVGSSSGVGVYLFEYSKKRGVYISKKDGTVLTDTFLKSYNANFVLQLAIVQHPDIARFNPTSVNTLRIAVYRSWKNEEPHVLASIMRVGRSGEFVDNAHAGGMYVRLDVETGKVGELFFDQYGNSSNKWNGIDFSNNEFYIPNWEGVKNFVCEISKKIVHHRLIAFDISVDEEGRPVLIEYNLDAFSYWLFMFTNQNPLGEYTDEIIEFCIQSK